MMERGNLWTVVVVCFSILSPVAIVSYTDIFLELSNTFIVFPWFSISPSSMTIAIHGFDFYTLNGAILLFMGIVWVFSGLVMNPVTMKGVKNSRRLVTIMLCLSILIVQSLIFCFRIQPNSLPIFCDIGSSSVYSFTLIACIHYCTIIQRFKEEAFFRFLSMKLPYLSPPSSYALQRTGSREQLLKVLSLLIVVQGHKLQD